MLLSVRALWAGLVFSFGSAAMAGTQGFRLAGHSGVASVEESSQFRVSRGTDDLLFVWTKPDGLPRAWRRIEPDAGTIVQGDRVGLFGDVSLEWLALPSLETTSTTEIAGSVRCRGAAVAWTWTSEGVVTLHDATRSEMLDLHAAPGEDASCLLSPLGAALIWSEEDGVAALVHGVSTQILRASIPNDGLVDAGASSTSIWASVRSAGTDKVVRTTLLGTSPANTTASSGWRTCDTFDAAGQPTPCQTLVAGASEPVTRPKVPAWNRAKWQRDRLALGVSGESEETVPGEAGWAPWTTEPTASQVPMPERSATVVRGRRLAWREVWMAGCAEHGWQVEEQVGPEAWSIFGPICGAPPHWVPLPDDRWALLQIPDRATALVWSDGVQPGRLELPEARSLSLTAALHTESGWWVADALQGKAWRQNERAPNLWDEAAVPLLADRSLILFREGEVLTIAPNDPEIGTVHLLVTNRGTAAWRDDGRWWADATLRRQLVWVDAAGTPFASDDETVERRFDRQLLERLWERLVEER